MGLLLLSDGFDSRLVVRRSAEVGLGFLPVSVHPNLSYSLAVCIYLALRYPSALATHCSVLCLAHHNTATE